MPITKIPGGMKPLFPAGGSGRLAWRHEFQSPESWLEPMSPSLLHQTQLAPKSKHAATSLLLATPRFPQCEFHSSSKASTSKGAVVVRPGSLYLQFLLSSCTRPANTRCDQPNSAPSSGLSVLLAKWVSSPKSMAIHSVESSGLQGGDTPSSTHSICETARRCKSQYAHCGKYEERKEYSRRGRDCGREE